MPHVYQILEGLLAMSYSKKVKEQILTKGLEVYKQDPAKLNNHFVAKELNVSNAKIHYHFGTNLKEAVLRHAVDKGDSHVIVELIASKDRLVKHLTQAQRKEHMDVVYS